MPHFARHLFVCTNQRPPGHPKGCCKDKGSEEVREAFKQELAARGLSKIVRANAAGCLDQCALGVSVVVYPEQVWYGQVTVADVPEIVDRHIVGGQFVTRLMMPDQPHLGGATSAPPLAVPDARPAP